MGGPRVGLADQPTRHLGHVFSTVSRVAAQHAKRILHRHVEAFVEEPFGLLDDDPAGQRGAQAGHHGRRCGWVFLQDRYAGDVCQRSGEKQISVS